MSRAKLLTLAIIIASTTLSYGFASKMKFFRYKDDNGKTVVSSTLPPKYSQNGYEIVNELGIVLETIEPRKTEAQLLEEARQKAELEEQARLAREQQRLDTILIESYSDISDIERARDNEVDSKNRDIMLLRQNIRRMTRLLEDKQALAARDERLGQEVGEKTLKEIDDFKKRIAREQKEITLIEDEIKEITERYDSSMIRFSELKAAEQLRRHTLGETDASGSRATIYQCNSSVLCDTAWQASLVYASENSTTELAWANNTTIMMRKPTKNSDISLMITRINTEGGQGSLVLEVRCNKSQEGEDFCDSERVQSIRSGFIPFLSGG